MDLNELIKRANKNEAVARQCGKVSAEIAKMMDLGNCTDDEIRYILSNCEDSYIRFRCRGILDYRNVPEAQ